MTKKEFLLNLLILTIIILLGVFPAPVFAQGATATPRPTFGPTCTPSPPPAGPTATPVLPVTAGSTIFTSLALAAGGLFLLSGLGAYLFLLNRQGEIKSL